MIDPADIEEPPSCVYCDGYDTNRTEDHDANCPMIAEPPDDIDRDDYAGEGQ